MNNNSSSSGVGIFGVLLIVFIVLKLCGVIAWSWWLVLIPLWISLVWSLIIIAVLVLLKSKSNARRKAANQRKSALNNASK